MARALIKHSPPDDVLQRAYEKFTDARQKPAVDERKFADCSMAAAQNSCNAVEDRELVI